MRTYGQFCPVARGAEVLGERWTLIIVRNILNGAVTFNDIALGCPGLSRSLLSARLHELKRAGVLTIRPKQGGRGSVYEPTEAGLQLDAVIGAVADWAEQWADVTEHHSDPAVVLWAISHALRGELLPERRTVVRFDFVNHRGKQRHWLLIDDHEGEICTFDPGFGDDLVVVIHDPVAFAHWHLGRSRWSDLLRAGAVELTGPPGLRRALPTWDSAPDFFVAQRAAMVAR
jgi:DNA-binding HxlR family transcriptional regulator